MNTTATKAPYEVLDCLEAIQESGLVPDMSDARAVAKRAMDLGCIEVTLWIDANLSAYRDGIANGFERVY